MGITPYRDTTTNSMMGTKGFEQIASAPCKEYDKAQKGLRRLFVEKSFLAGEASF